MATKFNSELNDIWLNDIQILPTKGSKLLSATAAVPVYSKNSNKFIVFGGVNLENVSATIYTLLTVKNHRQMPLYIQKIITMKIEIYAHKKEMFLPLVLATPFHIVLKMNTYL